MKGNRMDTDPDSHFNRAEVLERVGGDTELLQELIEYAREDFPSYLRTLQESVQNRNPVQIKRAAHKLKGFARNMGFSQLAVLALQAEQHHNHTIEVQQKDVEDIRREIEYLETIIS